MDFNNTEAFKFVEDLARELSDGTVDLPGFPSAFVQVCRALDDPRNTNERTAQIINAEPALAARIIMLANSVTVTHAGKPVSDLKSAITRLGGQSIRAAASAFAVSQVARQPSLRAVRTLLVDLWKRSTFLAALCHVIARNCNVPSEEALLAGLLHGIGTLYLLARSSAQPTLVSNNAALLELTLEWNAPITCSILENWSFPEAIVDAVGNQEDFGRMHRGSADLTDVLLCSKALVRCEMNREHLETEYAQVPAFAKVGLSIAQYLAVVQHAQLQIAAMQEALNH